MLEICEIHLHRWTPPTFSSPSPTQFKLLQPRLHSVCDRANLGPMVTEHREGRAWVDGACSERWNASLEQIHWVQNGKARGARISCASQVCISWAGASHPPLLPLQLLASHHLPSPPTYLPPPSPSPSMRNCADFTCTKIRTIGYCQ